MVPIIRGMVTAQGKLTLPTSERQKLNQHLQALKDQPVDVIVRKRQCKRTLDQNAYLHAVPVPILAAHFGYTDTEMKLVLMGERFGWKKVGGHEVPVKPHTSDMTVDEATSFIEWLIPWAMTEHDVTIPYPNEVDW